MSAPLERRNAHGFPIGSEPVRYAWDDTREGGTFWPKLSEPELLDSEPMSEAAKAFCYGAIAFAVTAIISALLYSLWLSR